MDRVFEYWWKKKIEACDSEDFVGGLSSDSLGFCCCWWVSLWRNIGKFLFMFWSSSGGLYGLGLDIIIGLGGMTW